jgi:hypothetical protein
VKIEDLEEGKAYYSTTHGIVDYKGIDVFQGQSTLHFYSWKHGDLYWLPQTLDQYIPDKQLETRGDSAIVGNTINRNQERLDEEISAVIRKAAKETPITYAEVSGILGAIQYRLLSRTF